MSRKICCTLVLLLLFIAVSAQQGYKFVFYKQAELLYNPSIAGASGDVSGVLLNRLPNNNGDGAPSSTLFSASLPAEFISASSGLGINIVRDEVDLKSAALVNLNYSYKFEKAWGLLGFGLSAGVVDEKAEDEAIDLLLEDENGIGFDLGLGAYIKTDELYLSLGIAHLNRANVQLSDTAYLLYTRQYYIDGRYDFKFDNPNFILGTSILFKTDANDSQLDLNVDLRYKDRYEGGVGYRINDGFIFRFLANLNNGIVLGYAYDATAFNLPVYNGGSHEFFVGYSFSLLKKNAKAYKSVRYL